MPIIKREIEEYDDGLNITYFLIGDIPKSKILVDEIDGFIYKKFGINPFGEEMYYRIPIDRFKDIL